MAYPKALNEKYKAEKAAGTTTASSFKEWNSAQQAVDVDKELELAFAALEAIEQAQVAVDKVIKVSKSTLAEAIFVEAKNKGELVRKDILASFQKAIEDGGAGLSIKGSNTYLHNLKEKYGLVVHKS